MDTQANKGLGPTRKSIRLVARPSLPVGRLHKLYSSPVGMLGFTIVSAVILLAIFGSLIVPHDPAERNLRARFEPPGFSDGTNTYILGTDQLGRDIFSRIIVGCRV